MRYAAKPDGNQRDFIGLVEGVGLSVANTSRLGDGFTDIVVGGVRRTDNELAALLVEIKAHGKENAMTDKEIVFERTWSGPYMRTSEPRDVLIYFGLLDDEYSAKCVVHE